MKMPHGMYSNRPSATQKMAVFNKNAWNRNPFSLHMLEIALPTVGKVLELLLFDCDLKNLYICQNHDWNTIYPQKISNWNYVSP